MSGLPKHLSPSGMDLWQKCARKWMAKYVLGVEDPPGIEAQIGTMAHEALEHLGRLDPGQRVPGRAREIVVLLWDGTPPELRQAAWTHVVRALRMPDVAFGRVVAVEQKLDGDIGGVPFFGFLDRLDRTAEGGLVVADYKTGKRPDRPEWLAAKRTQIMLYAAVWQALHGEAVEMVELIWTAHSMVDRWAVRPEDLTAVVGELRRVWDEITEAFATGEFAANPSALCGWCPYLEQCPEGQAAVVDRVENQGRPVGEHGTVFYQRFVDERLTDQLERSVAVVERRHLSVVDSQTA